VNDLKTQPYQYKEEIIHTTGDFYSETDAEIGVGLVTSPQIWTGEPTASMINGMSGMAPVEGRLATDSSCQPYLINVHLNTTYRTRKIGATAISLLSIAFEDHCNLTIIETDGSYVQPAFTDHMQADTGQRFSLLFQTKTVVELQALGNRTQFWVQTVNPEATTNVTGYAVLNYQLPGNASSTALRIPDAPLLPVPTPPNEWLEYTFHNLDIPGYGVLPTLSQVTLRVPITSVQLINPGTNGQQVEELYGAYWPDERPLEPSTQIPYLVNIYLNGQSAIPNYTAPCSMGPCLECMASIDERSARNRLAQRC
jgi:L-ascorbate oxidase